MHPDSLPFRIDSERRTRASKEDYLSECEMVENTYQTQKIQLAAFDEFDY